MHFPTYLLTNSWTRAYLHLLALTHSLIHSYKVGAKGERRCCDFAKRTLSCGWWTWSKRDRVLQFKRVWYIQVSQLITHSQSHSLIYFYYPLTRYNGQIYRNATKEGRNIAIEHEVNCSFAASKLSKLDGTNASINLVVGQKVLWRGIQGILIIKTHAFTHSFVHLLTFNNF